MRLNLVVVETYQTVNAQGLPVSAEHRVPGLLAVRLHSSGKEVRDLAVEFLVDFSQQRVSPDQVVRGFATACRARAPSARTCAATSREFTITGYSVEPNPPVTIAFGEFCRNRDRSGDACVYVPVRWESTRKSDGRRVVSSRHRPGQRHLREQPLAPLRQRLPRHDALKGQRTFLRFKK